MATTAKRGDSVVREFGLDLDALGAELAARKAELMALLAPEPVA
ncbi:MAG: hypothetical protein JWQ29_1562 [Phenylobacterium sp.]|nr:hypothetical protein [Phenylobacterium sp.]